MYPVKTYELGVLNLQVFANQNNRDNLYCPFGEPTQNSYIERFSRTYRDEVLNMYAFKTPTEVREITDNWICEYNEERPHDAQGSL